MNGGGKIYYLYVQLAYIIQKRLFSFPEINRLKTHCLLFVEKISEASVLTTNLHRWENKGKMNTPDRSTGKQMGTKVEL